MTAPTPSREDFATLAQAQRPALRRHCYRMLGGLADADDAVQETLLRGWRGFDGYAGGSFRAWLYRIATRACLDELHRRADARRWLPDERDPARAGDPGPSAEILWLEPLPDEPADDAPGPEARYAEREAVRLAFVAAIQGLPPRPRAALLLADVLGWPAAEAAETLETSLAGFNSGLQRARATLAARYPAGRPEATAAPTPGEAAVLRRYLDAWESHDIDALVATLREDARCNMPPWRLWLPDRAAIAAFFAQAWLSCTGLRLRPCAANSSPAFAVYQRGADGRFHANALHVLALEGEAIAAMTLFLDDGPLFSAFGLPTSLDG